MVKKYNFKCYFLSLLTDEISSDSDPLGDFNMIQRAYPDIEEEDIMTPKTDGARSQSSPSSPRSESMKSGEFNIELEDR